MKEITEIIDDIFSKETILFSRGDLVQIANIYSAQFKWVKTTCGKSLEFDDIDYEQLRKQPVFFDKRREIVMALWFSEEGKRIVAPIAKLLLKAEGRSVIRYKDKNPLNLKRSNLEIINRQKAHFKEKKTKTYKGEATTSIYKGVSWNKFASKWSAYIKVDNAQKFLGYHINEEDAAEAYNVAAVEYFGKEYVELNNLITNEKRTTE